MPKIIVHGHEIEVSKDGKRAVVRKVLSRRQLRPERNRVAPEILFETGPDVAMKDDMEVEAVSAQVKAIQWAKAANQKPAAKPIQPPKPKKPEVKE